MTIQQFISQLRTANNKLVRSNVPLAKAALTVHTEMIKRIFANSLDANITPITWKGGGKREGAYSKRWASARKNKGRQIGRVDFTYTGDFKKDFEGRGSKPTKINVNNYGVEVTFGGSDDYINTWENEYYNQEIFAFSQRERALMIRTAELELRLLYDF